MKRFLCILGLAAVLGGCAEKAAENPSTQPQSKAEPQEVVRQLAQEVAAATINGDYERIVDLTYDSVVEYLGGRAETIAQIREGLKTLKGEGIKIKSVDVGEPGEFINDGGTTFVVLPTETEMEMTTPPMKIIGKSYLLGISSDGGKSWKFVDVMGMGMADENLRDEILPLLPKALKLPKVEPPEIINKDN
jgi:hypothetical protein